MWENEQNRKLCNSTEGSKNEAIYLKSSHCQHQFEGGNKGLVKLKKKHRLTFVLLA